MHCNLCLRSVTWCAHASLRKQLCTQFTQLLYALCVGLGWAVLQSVPDVLTISRAGQCVHDGIVEFDLLCLKAADEFSLVDMSH